MPSTQGQQEANAEVEVIDPAVVERFAKMAMLIPSEDGSGIERIIDAILSAESWETLDDPWDTTNVKTLEGKLLRINSLMRRPSSFKGGLGVFLVVHAINMDKGDKMVITTGSVNVVAQLVRAYALGVLPIFARWVVADRPTENGYYPHHLEIVGVAPPENGTPPPPPPPPPATAKGKTATPPPPADDHADTGKIPF